VRHFEALFLFRAEEIRGGMERGRTVRARVLFKDLFGLTTLQAGSEAAADSSNGHAELKQESYRVRCS
jgi:hypothetical protein